MVCADLSYRVAVLGRVDLECLAACLSYHGASRRLGTIGTHTLVQMHVYLVLEAVEPVAIYAHKSVSTRLNAPLYFSYLLHCSTRGDACCIYGPRWLGLLLFRSCQINLGELILGAMITLP